MTRPGEEPRAGAPRGDCAPRRQLAALLRSVLADAANPLRPPRGPRGNWLLLDVVESRREPLLGLAAWIEHPRPVSSVGLARLHRLLADATGPLYSRASARTLDEMIWWVADGLQLCPPHDWQCPVVMKVDPGQVAWTCTLCGAIATTDGLAARPA